MMDSLKIYLDNNPGTSLVGTLGGFVLSLTEILTPVLSFIILFASAITAVCLAYIQLKKARAYVKKKSSKKGSRNSR